jgi:hypothetical protein
VNGARCEYSVASNQTKNSRGPCALYTAADPDAIRACVDPDAVPGPAASAGNVERRVGTAASDLCAGSVGQVPPAQPAPAAATQAVPQRHLAELPRHCSLGVRTSSDGNQRYWRGYKLHIDVADGHIPITCLLTAASLHDSQAAIPLATLTAQRVTSLYDVMDSAYDVREIRDHSRSLGCVPIIA